MAFTDWSTNPALNANQPGIDWAEGMEPKEVNNSARQMMADLAVVKFGVYYNTARGHGAPADGTGDSHAGFLAADAAGPFQVTPGSYILATDTTVNNPIGIQAGAIITINNGITLTINGALTAGTYQIFNCVGTGKVVFNHSATWYGFAEWWGAKADQATNCTPPITAASNALITVQLLSGTYLLASTLEIQNGHRNIIGVGSKYDDTPNNATRLLIADGAQYGVLIGPSTSPGSINSFQKDNLLQDLYIARGVAPIISSQCCGLIIQFTLYTRVINVKVAEHMIGVCYNGAVTPKIIDCESVRSVAGTGAGTDFWYGFWSNGAASIGAAGGNASVYQIRCAANCNYGPLQTAVDCVGFYLSVAFTDNFLQQPETTNCYDGIRIVGTGTLGNTFTNTDMMIDHPIMDQFHRAGVFMTQIAEAGSVEVFKPYCGPATNARSCLWVDHSQAAVNFIGGQLVMGASPNCQAMTFDTSSGVTVEATMVLEHGPLYPAVAGKDITNCVLRPKLKNRSVTADAAVQIFGSPKSNILQPTVMGKAGAFTFGIQVLGTTDDRNEYNLSGIDSSCINGGSANKLLRNGVQIVAAGTGGPLGTNVGSGVFT
jgi:hypothetical protein